ncbi:TPA: hypothetical protein TXL33_000850 [Streptococcus suis]|nr:hypothetical protein [Streptococcus suis]MBY5022701.1 hypothetical protein [Streptococcus suis]HEL1592414.1 hypothetical protein [Streptococcus suis]
MIYTIEQIEQMYDQFKSNIGVADIKEFQNIKTITKPEKIKADVKLISY